MATIQTGRLDPLLLLLLQAGFGQGRQQGYQNIQSALQLREQVKTGRKARKQQDMNQMLGLAGILAAVSNPFITDWLTQQPQIFQANPVFQARPVQNTSIAAGLAPSIATTPWSKMPVGFQQSPAGFGWGM